MCTVLCHRGRNGALSPKSPRQPGGVQTWSRALTFFGSRRSARLLSFCQAELTSGQFPHKAFAIRSVCESCRPQSRISCRRNLPPQAQRMPWSIGRTQGKDKKLRGQNLTSQTRKRVSPPTQSNNTWRPQGFWLAGIFLV